jgi:hypothetical protein
VREDTGAGARRDAPWTSSELLKCGAAAPGDVVVAEGAEERGRARQPQQLDRGRPRRRRGRARTRRGQWTTSPGAGSRSTTANRPIRRGRRPRPAAASQRLRASFGLWPSAGLSACPHNDCAPSFGRGRRGVSAPCPHNTSVAPWARSPPPRLAIAGAMGGQQAPEARRVVQHGQVAGLVPDDVVEDVLGRQQQPPVEAQRAGGRAAAQRCAGCGSSAPCRGGPAPRWASSARGTISARAARRNQRSSAGAGSAVGTSSASPRRCTRVRRPRARASARGPGRAPSGPSRTRARTAAASRSAARSTGAARPPPRPLRARGPARQHDLHCRGGRRRTPAPAARATSGARCRDHGGVRHDLSLRSSEDASASASSCRGRRSSALVAGLEEVVDGVLAHPEAFEDQRDPGWIDLDVLGATLPTASRRLTSCRSTSRSDGPRRGASPAVVDRR